jgi:hypothetical protein
MSNDGRDIVTAIQDQTARAISDGSFQASYGSTYSQHATGQVVAPGLSHDHTHIEVSSLASLCFHYLCKFYSLNDGAIILGCDGELASYKAFSDTPPSTSSPCFDIKGAIFNLRSISKIQWDIKHVHGHQDSAKSAYDLDEWETLNLAMDAAAKGHIAVVKQRPR